MNPEVSIIVPVYNVEKYLAKCIDSILNQNFFKFELLLIDDGSTDNSANLCKKYEKDDVRIRYFHKENGGLSDTRNFGLKQAKGKFVVFVDSDDYLDKDYLKDLYFNIIKYNADVSIVGFNIVTDNGNKIMTCDLNEPNNITLLSGRQLIEYTFEKENSLPNIVSWNKIYKRSLFKNLKFEKGRFYEDEYIFVPLFWNVKKIGLVRKNLYNYVKREGSITSSQLTIKKIKDVRDLYLSRFKFFKSKDKDLYFKCVDMYKSWIIEIMSENANNLQKEVKSTLQHDFRTYKSKKLKLRNILGYVSIKFTGKIKRILVKN